MPKNIVLKISEPEVFQISPTLKQPKVTEHSTSFVSILSTNTRILKIHSFHYQSIDTDPHLVNLKPVFHAFTIELEGKVKGKADLIITTEMTIKDTLRQFSDTIHVSIEN